VSFRDRPYSGEGGQPGPDMGGAGVGAFARPGPAVKWLLIVTVVTFLLQIFLDQPAAGAVREWGWMSQWLGARCDRWWQLWRYVTFQFLHDVHSLWHILFNMLGLYFLGMPLERYLGTRRFLVFYLSCGGIGGLAYVIAGSLLGQGAGVPIVGASGGVYAVLLGAAIYLPHLRMFLLFLPIAIPIRVLAGIIFAFMLFTVLTGLGRLAHGAVAFDRAMSDICHLGGAVAALGWVLVWRYHPGAGEAEFTSAVMAKIRSGAWQRRMRRQAELQAEIDRILQKIHGQGLNALSSSEKRLLKKATQMQREEDQRVRRL
jgi:membrane associated rhomboid family serine protease